MSLYDSPLPGGAGEGAGGGGDGEASHAAEIGGAGFNERFQRALALPEGDALARRAKYRLLAELASDFEHLAGFYGRLIAEEAALPSARKTLQPRPTLGFAGGSKFVVGDILFKFARDPPTRLSEGAEPRAEAWLHGGADGPSDERAAKAAAHDLRGANVFFRLRGQLCVPMHATVDCGGFRLVAMPVLPIVQGADPVYGSRDAGRHVFASHALFSALMRDAAAELHLAEHTVQGVRLCCAGDVEGHAGADGRLYLLDLARAMPAESPADCAHLRGDPAVVFSRLLRPELLRLLKLCGAPPLSSDALSAWGGREAEAADMNDRARAATRFLVQAVVPFLAAQLAEAELRAERSRGVGAAASSPRASRARHGRLTVETTQQQFDAGAAPSPLLSPRGLSPLAPLAASLAAVAEDAPGAGVSRRGGLAPSPRRAVADEARGDDEGRARAEADAAAAPPQATLEPLASLAPAAFRCATLRPVEETCGVSSLDDALSALPDALHRRGVALRHMGLLFSLLPLRAARVRSELLREMVTRALKNMLRGALRGGADGAPLVREWLQAAGADASAAVGHASASRARARVAAFLSLVTRNDARGARFWEEAVAEAVARRFGACVVEEVGRGALSAAVQPHLRRIVLDVCEGAGVALTRACEDALGRLGGVGFCFVSADVGDVGARVKCLGVVAYAQARALADEAWAAPSLAAVRLLALALERLAEAQRADPLNGEWRAEAEFLRRVFDARRADNHGDARHADEVALATARDEAVSAAALEQLAHMWRHRRDPQLRARAGAASLASVEGFARAAAALAGRGAQGAGDASSLLLLLEEPLAHARDEDTWRVAHALFADTVRACAAAQRGDAATSLVALWTRLGAVDGGASSARQVGRVPLSRSQSELAAAASAAASSSSQQPPRRRAPSPLRRATSGGYPTGREGAVPQQPHAALFSEENAHWSPHRLAFAATRDPRRASAASEGAASAADTEDSAAAAATGGARPCVAAFAKTLAPVEVRQLGEELRAAALRDAETRAALIEAWAAFAAATSSLDFLTLAARDVKFF